MGKHKEWRKVAKKMRRKRIRTRLAKLREELEEKEEETRCRSPTYAARLAEEVARQASIEAEERRKHEEEHKRWEEVERAVQEETALRQTLLTELENAKEKRKLEEKEIARKKKEAEKEKQEKLMSYIYEFAQGERCSLPAEMLVPSETQPGREVCPFFSKVAACRFWDTCSRNHIRPALSDTLLFPGFYSHFTMSGMGQAEYDTDMTLEYDDKETYSHFLEFYRDIRYEFEACGRLMRILVCRNPEPHLRGNVYVSYASEKETMTAYLKFNGRYYGGKRLSCHFVTITSWRNAICGLYFRKKCPKGNSCNFLHVFKDPGPPFYEPPNKKSPEDWRWSVTPERVITSKENDADEVENNRDSRRKLKRRGESQDTKKNNKNCEKKRRGGSGESTSRSRTRERRSRSRGRIREKRSRSRERSQEKRSRSRGRSLEKGSRSRRKSREKRSKSRGRSLGKRSRSREGSRERRSRSRGRKEKFPEKKCDPKVGKSGSLEQRKSKPPE